MVSKNSFRFSPIVTRSFLITGIIATIFGCPHRMLGQQEVSGPQPAEQVHQTLVETQLRWKFAPGDVIRAEMRVNETVVDDENKEYQTERIYDYRWTVNSVEPDGTATITVSFDRFRFHSEWFSFDYDSLLDDATVGTTNKAKRYAMLYQFRALVASQFVIQVTPCGAIQQIVAAESVVGPMQFTPGDLPSLPEKPVKVGDSWTVGIEATADYIQSKGQAAYELSRLQRSDDKFLCGITGTSRFSEHTGLPPNSEMGTVESQSRFDPQAGMFVDEKLTSKLRSEVAPGKIVSVRVDTTRRFFPEENQIVETVKSGEYLFVFVGENAKPIILAGVPVGFHKEPVSEALHLNFYHTWTDTDEDGLPLPEELSDISTRFAAGEPVNFALLTVGLQDVEFYFDVVGIQGRNGKHVIPIRDENWFAIRTIPELEPGVYFFEFFMNGRHLVRVPVQISPSLD